jgi:hypothetical protein
MDRASDWHKSYCGRPHGSACRMRWCVGHVSIRAGHRNAFDAAAHAPPDVFGRFIQSELRLASRGERRTNDKSPGARISRAATPRLPPDSPSTSGRDIAAPDGGRPRELPATSQLPTGGNIENCLRFRGSRRGSTSKTGRDVAGPDGGRCRPPSATPRLPTGRHIDIRPRFRGSRRGSRSQESRNVAATCGGDVERKPRFRGVPTDSSPHRHPRTSGFFPTHRAGEWVRRRGSREPGGSANPRFRGHPAG